jgi:WD40 repeat protein
MKNPNIALSLLLYFHSPLISMGNKPQEIDFQCIGKLLITRSGCKNTCMVNTQTQEKKDYFEHLLWYLQKTFQHDNTMRYHIGSGLYHDVVDQKYNQVYSVCFNPTGTSFATISCNKQEEGYRINIFDREKNQKISSFECGAWYNSNGNSMSFNRTGTSLIMASGNNSVCTLDIETEKEADRFTHQKYNLECRDCHNDSTMICSTCFNNTETLVAIGSSCKACVFDKTTKQKRACFPHSEVVSSIRFNNTGTLLATTCNGWVRIFDIETEKEMYVGKGNKVCFNDTGTLCAIAGYHNKVCILDTKKYEEIASFQHNGGIHSLRFDSTGKFLITAAGDWKVHIFDIETKKEVVSLLHTNEVRSADIDSTGKFIVTASGDTVYLFAKMQ